MKKTQHWSTPISEAWTVFILHCKSQRYRKKTLDDYRWKLLPFLDWLTAQGVTYLGDIDARHIRTYMVHKQTIDADTPNEREASGHYAHGIARALRAFFNFCVGEEWLEKSPMATVKMPRRPKKILDAYTSSNISKLIKVATADRERLIVHILLDTGIRASECINLQAGDIRMATNSILVREGKGEKDRIVYFGAKTARLLIRYMRGMEPEEPLFANQLTGKQLTYFGLAQLLRRLGKVAGIPCTAHKFRRTFAINSLRNGMSVYILAKLMGHEDISILRPYLDLLETDLQKGHQLYGVVDNL